VKELRTSFRDRQTAIYAVVLPICMYPVMFWLMIQGALLVQGRREHTAVHVGLATAPGVEVPAGLVEALASPEGVAETLNTEESPDAEELTAKTPLKVVDVEVVGEAADAETAFAEWRGEADALLYLDAPGDPENAPALVCYDSTESRSNLAESRLDARVGDFAESLRVAAAKTTGVPESDLHPIRSDSRNLAPDEQMGAFMLSMILPLLLVVMTVMGSFYPAVDLTAGERERGTSETTMILPIPRLAVQQGKILAVCASALLATALNLLALGLSAGHLLEMIAVGSSIQIELPMMAFLSIAPLALLFCFSVSALLTGIAALAKSFKEGQALLGPVQLLFIMPAMAGVLPGLELNTQTAFVPVVNVVLAFRAMLRGEALPLAYTLTALSLFVYAWLAIAFAVRVLSRESLSVGSETIPLRKLFGFLRTEKTTR